MTLLQENVPQSPNTRGRLDTANTPLPSESTQTGAGPSTATGVPQVGGLSGCSTFPHIPTTSKGRTGPIGTPANMQDVRVYFPSDSLADLFC